jgi:hypothetical protein
MTKSNVPQNPEGFRVELKHQAGQAAKAADLLQQARLIVESDKPDEGLGERAQRLRGAAVVAQQATAELWTTCGWFEAAEAADRHDLLAFEGDADE